MDASENEMRLLNRMRTFVNEGTFVAMGHVLRWELFYMLVHLPS